MSFYTVKYISLLELSIEITIDLLQTNRNDNLTLKINHKKLIDDHGLISSIK